MKIDKLAEFLKKEKVPAYRLKQIKEAYFKQNLGSFNDISSLPLSLREKLTKNFSWLNIKPEKTLGSKKEGAVKAALTLEDGLKIESVLMFYRNWNTACLSVMVGCPLGCEFCATGQMGFKRNLTDYEITDQIVFWNRFLNEKGGRVGKVVFMGMGEPFLNWENTFQAIKTINSKDGLNIGQRNITVSTAGIPGKIKEFADLETQINLAISLHSPFQEKREEIMPSAKKNTLGELMASAEYYVKKTNRKLFFEYALIKNINDRKEDALEIAKLFRNKLFHLNLINLNPTGSKHYAALPKNIAEFTKILDQKYIPYTIRRSVGASIQAACGQLAAK
ncbi:23S rRNA (adenine(2503)-C(2))-methyltransferase RlmN [Candidatus Microgenomates bacterium]|jgi:23S rRNA (adenine2503-C2)-methyltransferase|nr:MAG: 23S rRNA (adenine(2503)-C(2))-methyltransferase RlmN [Candidatus Microgenomates bacterium]